MKWMERIGRWSAISIGMIVMGGLFVSAVNLIFGIGILLIQFISQQPIWLLSIPFVLWFGAGLIWIVVKIGEVRIE